MAKKKETKKLINITPHKSLMLKVGQTGYSIQEAISELIDNSIDARFIGKKLLIDIKVSPKAIQISDNGSGMSESDAAKSIRLGFSSKTKQLGEFGLGLKTASTFLGKHFTIITTPKGKSEEYIITYDEDIWMKDGDWTQYPFTINHDQKSNVSGTTIIIEDIRIPISDLLIDKLKEELRIRFTPFIKADEIDLTINDEKVEPFEPQIIGKINKFKIVVGKSKVEGWWACQLQGLNKNYFGFNTFRRGRLVTTYDKIGLNPNQEVKQIIGEISIEGVPISHDKKSWQKGTEGYKLIQNKLREYMVGYEPKLKKLLTGFPASNGIYEGVARQINMFMTADVEKEMKKVKRGDIIVTAMTRPFFLLAIRRSGAIITDLGGSLCHAAIVAREFNIPAVVGTQQATTLIKDGQRVIVDGEKGVVYEA